MKKLISIQVIILLFFVLSSTVYAQKFKMEYNFQKGKVFRSNSQTTSVMTQSMMGQDMTMNMEISQNVDYKIEDVDKQGNGTINATFVDGTMKMSGVRGDTTMQLKDSYDLKKIIVSKIGKKISETVSEKGKAFQGTSEVRLEVLPEGEIKVGDKWNYNSNDSINANEFAMLVTLNMECSLAGKEKYEGTDVLKVTFSGKTTNTGKGNQMGMDLFMEGTGKASGFYYYDLKTNMVVYSESSSEQEMTIAVAGQQNMTIPITNKSKSITKVSEKK